MPTAALRVLLTKKPHSGAATRALLDTIQMIKGCGRPSEVVVEPQVAEELKTRYFSPAGLFREYSPSMADALDFVVAFGGDGTLLHVSSRFPNRTIPVLAIGLGTLSFLPPFTYQELPEMLNEMLRGRPLYFAHRRRLKCTVLNAQTGRKKVEAVLLNEVSIAKRRTHPLDPHVGNFTCFVDGKPVQGLGRNTDVIISTPTGSTGYALSAGGPIVHPLVEANLLMTPHSGSPPHLLSRNSIVTIKPDPGLECVLEADGQILDGDLTGNDVLQVQGAQHDFVLISRKEKADCRQWLSNISHVLHWNRPNAPKNESPASSESSEKQNGFEGHQR